MFSINTISRSPDGFPQYKGIPDFSPNRSLQRLETNRFCAALLSLRAYVEAGIHGQADNWCQPYEANVAGMAAQLTAGCAISLAQLPLPK